MTTPAENAATVREVLDDVGMGGSAPNEAKANVLAAVLALEAQAKEQEQKLDGYAKALLQMTQKKQAAEAERDRLGNELARERAKPGGAYDQAAYDQSAARVEELEAALRYIEANALTAQIRNEARAALDKETT